MVSPLSLYAVAATFLLLSAVVGRLRRTALREALADGGAALGGTLLALAAAITLFGLGRPLAASELWHSAGSLALLAAPLGATLALRARGRRSIPRALLTSSVALAGIVVWLTLSLRGPFGGWTATDVGLALPAAAVAIASAACLGWWSKPRAAAGTGRAAGR